MDGFVHKTRHFFGSLENCENFRSPWEEKREKIPTSVTSFMDEAPCTEHKKLFLNNLIL